MKVIIKCHKCNKEFKIKVDTMKEVRALKRDYNAGTFTCWDCMGVKGGVPGIGLITG